MIRTRLALFFCLALLITFSVTSWAQVTTATLSGTVTDPTGASTPNAKVTVTHQETGTVATKTTGSDGEFQFDFLRVGTYNITIEGTGFKRYEAKGIQLTAEDIREGIVAVLSVFVREPMFENQTKQRLTSPEMDAAVDGFVRPALESWLNSNKTAADAIIGRIQLAAKAREAMANGPANAVNVVATLHTNRAFNTAFGGFAQTLLFRGSVDARLREIMILRMGWNCQAVYEFGQHTLLDRKSTRLNSSH